MRTLQFGRRPARSGKPRHLVVFLHGYGADGQDLLGLADPLAPHLPDAVFVAPDAPDPCSGNPFGFQWFPIPWLDGSSEAAAADGLAQSAADLNGFLDGLLVQEKLEAAQTALIGFSQGTMMALHVALRRAEPLAGIVGFSGRLLYPDRLSAELRSRPPVLLAHGDEDPMVPFSDMAKAASALQDAGVAVQTHVSRQTGHGIAPDGLQAALRFLQSQLL